MIDPPDLVQADLTLADVEQLVADLAANAEAVEVAVKGATAQHARAGGPGPLLRDVPGIVESGSARGIQLRYRFDGSEWTDTLLIVPSGARLVRMRH